MSRALRLANLALLNSSPGAGSSTLGKEIPLSCLAFMQDNFLHSSRRQGSEGAIHSVFLSPGLSAAAGLRRKVGLNIFG